MNARRRLANTPLTVRSENSTGKGALYKQFYDQLVDELRETHRFTNAKGGAAKNWHTFSSGTSGFTYATVFASERRIRTEVYIDFGRREQNVAAIRALQANEPGLSRDFGEPLKWEMLEGKQACRVAAYRSGSIRDPPKLLKEHRQWIIERLLRFKKVFGPKLPAAAEQAG